MQKGDLRRPFAKLSCEPIPCKASAGTEAKLTEVNTFRTYLLLT